MDVEGQSSPNKKGLGIGDLKNHVKEKANNTTASGTLIVFLLVNIIMFLVGIIKLHECPIRRMVPIYLIVAGIVGILSKVLPFVNRKLEMKLITYFLSLLYIYEIFWMGAGSYWVYSIYKPNFDESQVLYCSKTAYLLAFWLLTINWILFILAILLICCGMAYAIFCVE